MAFRVTEIMQAVRYGISRPNQYQVTIIPKIGIPNLFSRELTILCQSAELPGRSMAVTPQTIYGVQRKMPYGVIYDDLNLSFICTGVMQERVFFDRWQSFITDPTNNYFNYYDDYVADIDIFKFNEAGQAWYYQRVEEAYPLSVQTQSLESGDENGYLILDVTFAYRRWRSAEEIYKGRFVNNGIDQTRNPGGNGAPGTELGSAPENPENIGLEPYDSRVVANLPEYKKILDTVGGFEQLATDASEAVGQNIQATNNAIDRIGR